jgi:glycosyltransferase involved in cell wall biosynthesis
VARISLCLIAKDEEPMLPGCLASVEGAVDEIVLVDTGSTDRTREIARAAGARVFEQPWREDFSAARNEALSHARGDFVLQLDADERLAPGSGEVLRRAADAGALDGGMLLLHDASRVDATAEEVLTGRARLGPPIRLGRFFRRAPWLRYSGIVHENLDDNLVEHAWRIAPLDAHLVHLGNVPAYRKARGKGERNLDLLRRRCALEPDDVTSYGYLAFEYVERGQMAEALAIADRGWALLDRQPAYRSVQRLALSRAYAHLRLNNPMAALETLERAETWMGQRADFDLLRGCALEGLAMAAAPGRDREAMARRAAAAHARALEPDRSGLHEQLVRQVGGPSNRCRLGCALLMASDLVGARAAFETALLEDPSSEEAHLGRAEARLEGGDATGAMVELEPFLGSTPEPWLIAALAALHLGARADAVLFATRARERAALQFTSPHRRALLGALTAALLPAHAEQPA